MSRSGIGIISIELKIQLPLQKICFSFLETVGLLVPFFGAFGYAEKHMTFNSYIARFLSKTVR